MERHKCKLCYRSFANGRALGGHMRSHMMNLPFPPPPPPPSPPSLRQLSEEAESASSPPSSPSSSEGEIEEKSQNYELRENPKRSIRFINREFSFAVDSASVILQDRESETESSKNPTRRRSKRRRLLSFSHNQYQSQHKLEKQEEEVVNVKLEKLSHPESWTEPDPVSSISETTTEENVAIWLMMLSRDKWTKQEEEEFEEEEEEEFQEEEERSLGESEESEELKFPKNRTKGKYKCETCKKSFRSYQALGGHRASHKKNKIPRIYDPELKQENVGSSPPSMAEKKIHECPVCFRVFSSGQALGGHKRSHVTSSSSAPPKISSSKLSHNHNFIDLNLPAPTDDDDEISQIEHSAVSDAEFVNPIRK